MFGALVRLSGLSANEAAHYLGVRRPEVIAWLRDEAAPPDEVMQKLYRLISAQEDAADEIIQAWEDSGRPVTLTLRIAADAAGAQAEGWPSVAAQMAPIAIAQATLVNVSIGFDVAE